MGVFNEALAWHEKQKTRKHSAQSPALPSSPPLAIITVGLCVTLANASKIEVQILFNSQLQAAHALTPTSRNLAQVGPPCNLRDSSDTHGPVIAFQLGHSRETIIHLAQYCCHWTIH